MVQKDEEINTIITGKNVQVVENLKIQNNKKNWPVV